MPPAVVVFDDDVTITFQKFEIPKPKKRRRRGSSVEINAKKAKGEFEVSIKNTTTNKIIKKVTKRNSITVPNLTPGSYSAIYRARLVQDKKVIAKSGKSPAATFTIEDSTT